MKSNDDIVEQFAKHKAASNGGLGRQYESIKECQAFYCGDSMDYRAEIDTHQYGGSRPRKMMVQFNKVKPYVNAVKGFMAQNRRKAKFEAMLPDNPLQVQYTQYANALHDYCRAHANADQKETQQDGDMLIGGVGAIMTAMTYSEGIATTNPNGEIVKGNIDILSCGWDPQAKEANLLDARFVFYGQKYALEDALKLFSDSKADDFDDASLVDDCSDYQWYPDGGRYNKIKMDDMECDEDDEDRVKVYFYQWFEIEDFYRADNPISLLQDPQLIQFAQSELQKLAADDEIAAENSAFGFDPTAEIWSFGADMKKKLVKIFGKEFQCHAFARKAYYTAVLSKKHVFTKYRSLSQTGFSIQFKTGDFDAKNRIWTGMVSSLKEPMLYYNKYLTEMMYVIAANSKGGVMYETGAVIDVAKFEQQYAKTDAAVEVQEGALSGGRIMPKRQPYQPSGAEAIIQLSDESISQVVGIDKSFLGNSDNKNETGVLQRQRIRQVVSVLACYFDSITLYQKMDARLMLDFMRVFAENNAGNLFRIIGQDGENMYLKIGADKLANDYDVDITEAPQSPVEKQEQAALLTDIAEKLHSAGDSMTARMVYGTAIKYMALEQADAQRIIQALTQPNPQMQQQQQMQMQGAQAKLAEAQAKVAVDQAKAKDIAVQSQERQAGAQKDLQDARRIALENAILAHNAISQPPEVRVNI